MCSPEFWDFQYGETVQQALREIDSPFFDELKDKECIPLDPNDSVFYEQFLRFHFQEERDIGSVVVAGLELYNGFNFWRGKALNAAFGTSQAACELRKIYTRMSLSGLACYVSGEVDRSFRDQEHQHAVFERTELILLESVVHDAAELERDHKEKSDAIVIIINPLDQDYSRQQGGY